MSNTSGGLARNRKILIGIATVLVLAQFIQPDRTPPTTDPANDLIAITKPAAEVEHLLHVACYDCHSNETRYPWYSRITPVNYWLKDHIDEGREEFNMSTWGARKEKWQKHKAKEAVEILEEKEMPLTSYTLVHGDARLSDAQRSMLVDFFKELR